LGYPVVLLTMSDRSLSTPVLATALMAKYQVPGARLSITYVCRPTLVSWMVVLRLPALVP